MAMRREFLFATAIGVGVLIASAYQFPTSPDSHTDHTAPPAHFAVPPSSASGSRPVSAATDPTKIFPKSNERKRLGLEVDPDLLAAMPPTPGNRALIAAKSEELMKALGEGMGIPEKDRPTYGDLLNDLSKTWMKQRLPEADVAALLRLEKQQRVDIAKRAGVDGSRDINEATNLTAVALTPYLQEAGLCSGDLFSSQGLVCNYVDRSPGGPHVKGSVRRGGAEGASFKEVPPDSALARILAAASAPAAATAPPMQMSGLLRKAGDWVAQMCGSVISSAHAQAGGFNVQNCTVQIPTEANTQVVKLDPYLLGLLLFQETVGLINDPEAPGNTFKNIAMATVINVWFQEAIGDIQESFSTLSNRAADREARNACRNLSGQAFVDCYGSVYANKVQLAVYGSYGLSLLSDYI